MKSEKIRHTARACKGRREGRNQSSKGGRKVREEAKGERWIIDLSRRK